MEPWQVCPPEELGKLALEAIFETWGRCREGQGMVHPLCPARWSQRNRGSRSSRSARAQGHYATQQAYTPLESTAMVAFGNQ